MGQAVLCTAWKIPAVTIKLYINYGLLRTFFPNPTEGLLCATNQDWVTVPLFSMSLAKVFSKHRLEAVEKLKLTAKTLYPVGQTLRGRAGGRVAPGGQPLRGSQGRQGCSPLRGCGESISRCTGACAARGVPLPVTTLHNWVFFMLTKENEH